MFQLLSIGLGSDHDDSHEEHTFAIAVLAVFFLLICYIFFGALMEHFHFTYIHETGLGIIIGFLVGMIFYFSDPQFYFNSLGFSQNFFMLFILPPIIFAGGYNLKKRRFFQNFFYISIFGLVGTLVNFGVVVGLTKIFSYYNMIRRYNNWEEVIILKNSYILLYSATICATDSVAALAMISSNKYPKLFSVIFGEGMVNDSVSIILFYSIYDLVGGNTNQEFTAVTPFKLLGDFIYTALFSVGFGLLYGLCATFMLKYARFLSGSSKMETALVFFWGYLAYMSAEILRLSGVISILVCGIFMAHYMFYNLSPTAKVTTGVTFETISLVSEAFLYVYLGISSWEYKGGRHDGEDLAWSWTFLLLQFGTLFIGRFISVFGTSWLFMICKGIKNWRLNVYETSIVWFAGTIRGAIAFALIQLLPQPDKTNEDQHAYQVIKSTTLFIVIISTIVLGALMPPFIKFRLGQMAKNLPPEVEETNGNNPSQQEPLIEGEDIQSRKYKGKVQSWWKKIDENYIKPCLIFDYEIRKEEIKLQKRKLKYNSDSFNAGSFLKDNLKRRDSYYQSVLQENNHNLNDTQQDDNEKVQSIIQSRKQMKIQNLPSDFSSNTDHESKFK